MTSLPRSLSAITCAAALSVATIQAGEPAPSSPSPATTAGVPLGDLEVVDGWRITFDDDPSVAVVFQAAALGDPAAWYSSVSADGEVFTDPVVSPTQLTLRVATFDPLASSPDFSDTGIPLGGDLQLVQYWTRPMPPYEAAVAAAGGRLVRYLGNNTFVAEVTASSAAIQALPFVRAVTPYYPALRVEPELASLFATSALADDQLYRIHVAERGLAAKTRVADAIESRAGQVVQLYPDGFNLLALLLPSTLPDVAAHDDVLWIERASLDPKSYMDKVRVDGGANYLETVEGMTGQGVRGEVLDIGCNINHADFQSPQVIVHKSAGSDPSHGTATYGIVFGDGTNSASARGLLPDAQGIFSAVNALGNRYTHTTELLLPPYQALFQSNSWGFQIGTSYTALSAEIDDICFINEDFIILQAMANFGNTVCDVYAWGKNVVSVGGIRHFDTQGTADDKWQNAGSIGPASDGRIKPDLSYWYDSIRTTAGNGGYTNNFGGTSAATPETAGHFGLMIQMWHEEMFGNASAGATVFASRPKASTSRAMMINGADAYPFTGASADLSRFHQGWGRADVERLHDRSAATFVVNEDVVLTNLGSASFKVNVPSSSDELRVTLAYKDPQGTPSSSVLLINDLTLRVTSPSGAIYFGNVGLLGGNASPAGGSGNHRDPIENVWIPNPQAGTWTLTVLAESIVQDQHTETPAIDADFALVASGVEPTFFDLGQALPGGAGAPSLAGRGYLIPGTRFEIEVSSAAPNAQGVLVLGASAASTPLLGGTLVPSPQLIAPITTNGAGGLELAGTVPASLAPGTTVYMQAWIQDATGPQGATASNALRIQAP